MSHVPINSLESRRTLRRFFGRLPEAARYCKFSELENTADAEDEMIRMKLSRDEDQQEVKTYIRLADMTTVLQFSEPAQHFAGMSKVKIFKKNCVSF